MEWKVSSNIISEIASEHYVIYPSSQRPEFKQILLHLNLPQIVSNNIYSLSIPEYQKNLFLAHYEMIQERNPYLLNPFSFDDFILSYIAAELNWSVISYDHHLLETIHQYLEFNAFYPSEVSLLPGDSVFLLDSNILLSFSGSKNDERYEILEMFQINQSMTFLIPDTILKETYRVHQTLSKSIQEEVSLYIDKEEKYIVKYIDEFNGFISNHAYRIRSKQLKKKTKRKRHKNPLQGRWGRFC